MALEPKDLSQVLLVGHTGRVGVHSGCGCHMLFCPFWGWVYGKQQEEPTYAGPNSQLHLGLTLQLFALEKPVSLKRVEM